MSKFEFDGEWSERVGRGIRGISRGQLPGMLGLTQNLMRFWAIPKRDRGVMRYGQALMDSVGTIYTYRHDQKTVQDEGRNPARVWLKDNGFELAYRGTAKSFTSFVRRALDGADFVNRQVKSDPSSTARGRLVGVEIEDDIWAYFIPSQFSDDAKETKNVDSWWDGPFVKPEHKPIFSNYVRDRIWAYMGTDALTISTTQGSIYERVELGALADDFDYICGTDEQNDVEALAKRHNAFLTQGMPRTVLFHGPPGTGKSTLARALARTLKTRAVLVDHEAIRRMSKSAYLIIWLLGPGVLILNDIDRGASEEHRELLQSLETEYAESERCLLTCLTVNDIHRLDPALLRPGRIDELREVAEPSKETRGIILDYFATKLKLDLLADDRTEFLDESDSFSPADIKEFCQTAKAVGVRLAIEEIDRIKKQRLLYAGNQCEKFNSKKFDKTREEDEVEELLI